jgi:hypothetical protein
LKIDEFSNRRQTRPSIINYRQARTGTKSVQNLFEFKLFAKHKRKSVMCLLDRKIDYRLHENDSVQLVLHRVAGRLMINELKTPWLNFI